MTFQEFKSKYPSVVSLSCGFHGSGDSFDELTDHEGVWLDKKSKEVQIPEDHLYEMFCDFTDVLWGIIEKDNRADFNNGGCSGKIKVNLKNGRVIINVNDFSSESIVVPQKMYYLHKPPESKIKTIESESCKEAYKEFIDEFPSINKIKINFNGYENPSCCDFFVLELIMQKNFTKERNLADAESLINLVKEIIGMDKRFDFTSEGSHGIIVIDCDCDVIMVEGHNYYREETPRCNNHWLITETQGIIEDAEEV